MHIRNDLKITKDLALLNNIRSNTAIREYNYKWLLTKHKNARLRPHNLVIGDLSFIITSLVTKNLPGRWRKLGRPLRYYQSKFKWQFSFKSPQGQQSHPNVERC